MTRTYLIRFCNFVILALVQVLIFSNIHLFGYATAYIYLLFILKLPRLTSRNELLMWGFFLGLIVDIFGNTPGINAMAATAVAFTRNSIMSAFITKETADDFIPSVHNVGVARYLSYALVSVLQFYILLFILELFTINYPIPLLISVASSCLLTMLFIAVAEFFTHK